MSIQLGEYNSDEVCVQPLRIFSHAFVSHTIATVIGMKWFKKLNKTIYTSFTTFDAVTGESRSIGSNIYFPELCRYY